MLTFVVAESPISNLYDGADYFMKEQFKLPGFMVAIGDSFAKKPLGSSMKDIDLVEMTEGCTVPLLVIQGDGDTVVDPAAVQSFYDGYAGEKQMILTSGAAHGMAYVENARRVRTGAGRHDPELCKVSKPIKENAPPYIQCAAARLHQRASLVNVRSAEALMHSGGGCNRERERKAIAGLDAVIGTFCPGIG